MCIRRKEAARAHGFTLIELLVVVAIIALLLSILMPSLSQARDSAKRAKCGAALRSFGQAQATCYSENNDYGPTWDDGAEKTITPYPMYSWVDVLFDLRYLSDPKAGVCPSDQRPDEVPRKRGDAGDWGYNFVEVFGRGDTPKPGIRTSYALNALLHYNFKEDRYQEAARQVYAIDGWWTWFTNLNAAWVMAGKVGPVGDPVAWPTPNSTMIGWRHGNKKVAQAVFMDSHVAPLTPIVPKSRDDLRYRTVDTTAAFSWLPGEYNWRERESAYSDGSAPNRATGLDTDPSNPLSGAEAGKRYPAWYYYYKTNRAKIIHAAHNYHPFNFPEHLSATYRTRNGIWRELPSDPQNRK